MDMEIRNAKIVALELRDAGTNALSHVLSANINADLALPK
jgi:hypothetical protein